MKNGQNRPDGMHRGDSPGVARREKRTLHRPAPDPSMPFGLRAALKPLRRRPLAFLALFWAIGAAAGYYGNAPWLLFALLALLFGGIALWNRQLACLCAAFLFGAAGITGAFAVQPARVDKHSVELEGVICAEIRAYDDYSLLTLNRVTLDGERYAHRVRLYLYPNEGGMPDIGYGDRITLRASVASPSGETGYGAYDSAAALWRAGIALTGNASAAGMEVESGSWSPMVGIMRLRAVLGEQLDRLYPQNGALARALLLGDKTRLSDEEYAAFQNAGIVHLLAVSGLHISVLAEALRLFLRKVLRFSRRTAYWTVLPFLLLYAAVTGFPASILRAAICFALMDAAPLLSRPGDRITGLAAAYLALVWLRPLSGFDAGFQLSFCAMLGLCLLAPVLQSALTPARLMEKRWGRLLWSPVQAVLGSLSVVISTLPACANLFGGLTVWSVLANIVAIPLTTALMPLMMLSLLLPAVSTPGGWMLSTLEWLAQGISALPADLYIDLPRMNWGFLAAYVCVGLLCSAPVGVARRSRRVLSRWKLLGVALLLGVAVLSAFAAQQTVLSQNGLAITFIDVGQGDSALVNAQGTCYLIDTGNSRAAANRLSSQGIRLQALFLTHPDEDHAGAVAAILEEGAPEQVYLPECWQRMEIPPEMEETLAGCNVVYLAAGDEITLCEGATATVLHPQAGFVPETDNAGSLVLLLQYGQGSALLMGDLPDADIDFPIPDCDVLKLAHHGSESSSGARLLAASSPSAAVISVGLNGYGHPAQQVLARLEDRQIPCFRTDERGDITAQILPGGGTEISCYLEKRAEEE